MQEGEEAGVRGADSEISFKRAEFRVNMEPPDGFIIRKKLES